MTAEEMRKLAQDIRAARIELETKIEDGGYFTIRQLARLYEAVEFLLDAHNPYSTTPHKTLW